MRIANPVKASKVAEICGGNLIGDDVEIKGVSEIESAEDGDLVFSDKKHIKQVQESKASVVVLPEGRAFQGKPCIEVKDVRVAMAKVLSFFFPVSVPSRGVSPKASVDKTAQLGDDVVVMDFAVVMENSKIGRGTVIYPNVVVGRDVEIGENCIIYPNVVIYDRVRIGNNVIIHSGAVIGADGFGYAELPDGSRLKIPQVGTVVIEDDVEIGANTTIDRSTLGETVIGKGTKIDNLVQVAHNVKVGKNVVLVAQVGVAGSTEIGDETILAGQVGVADHIKIGRKVIALAQSGIDRDVEDGKVIFGSPFMDAFHFKKVHIALTKLPELVKKIKNIEKQLGQGD